MSENLYVYGVIEARDLDLQVDGVAEAERVYTVTHRNLSALVSDIEAEEAERSDENVRAHDEVLREVLEHDGGHTIVPMQFGMVFASKRALENVLRGGRRAFTTALRDVAGTVELGVKVVSESDTNVDDERIRQLAAETFEPVSVDYVENGLFSDRLVVNRSYLVERDHQDEFSAAVESFENGLDEDVIVQYTGPWAPYNFVDIEIGAQR